MPKGLGERALRIGQPLTREITDGRWDACPEASGASAVRSSRSTFSVALPIAAGTFRESGQSSRAVSRLRMAKMTLNCSAPNRHRPGPRRGKLASFRYHGAMTARDTKEEEEAEIARRGALGPGYESAPTLTPAPLSVKLLF
jgi:hypothetical protein